MSGFLMIALGTSAATVIFLAYYVLLFIRRYRTHLDVPADVVILYQVGRGPFAPSISPFPLKLETFLRMAKIPYVNDHSGKFSSKGKTPWIRYNDLSVADSQFCVEYLKEVRDVDLNSRLSDNEKATARAFQKMTEENLYWTMCLEMFGEDTTAVSNVIPYTGLKLWFTLWFLRRVIRKETWGHGIGRHTPEEVWSIAVGDMKALSEFLGDKKFFMGDSPCEVDCAIFGMLTMIICNMPTSKHEVYLKENLPNLVQYFERMKDMFWPDWDQCILKSNSYVNDHGKIYNYEGTKTDQSS